MKTKLICSLFLFSLLAPGCGDGDSTITVSNESSFALEDIYIADVNTFDWGPDLLGTDLLLPGESITVVVPCGTYDIKVIDETGVPCELQGIEVCFSDDAWVIDDVFLDTCAFNVPPPAVVPRHGHVTRSPWSVEERPPERI